ncbi:MAG: hypothetical protein KAY37_17565 [Phycisphaerae bacterium]|nr:hypothetical protein [Phycisphaerae bacterium]
MAAYVGLVWLLSLLVATYLGYDRGRWVAGLLLGLLFGPLGVIAAGLMQPSLEYLSERTRAVQHEVAQLHRKDRLEVRKRRKARADLDAWVTDVERQTDLEDVGFADGLQELAADIEALAESEPDQDGKLRTWAGWLTNKAEKVRSSPRHDNEEA